MKITSLMLSLLVSVSVPVYGASNAPKMFETLKALEGTWQGRMTTTPKAPEVEGTLTTVTMRVASMGNVLLHEMSGEGRPDNPLTMLYLDGDALALTHYCDAGNRPRMAATMSEDGKSVEFDFVDVTGPMKYGHMRRARFTAIDADHHIEEWTFMTPGGEAVTARIEMERVGERPLAPPASDGHAH